MCCPCQGADQVTRGSPWAPTKQRLQAGPSPFLAYIPGGILQYKTFRRADCRSKSNPGPPSSSSMRNSRGKEIITLRPFQDFHALFPTMSSSSFLNTLQICSLQAMNRSRLLSLPAGDAPVSILLKKETLFQEFTKKRKIFFF